MEPVQELTFTNPSTGEAFGAVPMTPPSAVQTALNELRANHRWWSRTPVEDRIRILNRFHALMIDECDLITETISLDTGKSRSDALQEVILTADLLTQYSRHAPEWLQTQPVPRGLYLTKKCFVEYRPHGVVAVIGPWNLPFALVVRPVLAALLAGNTVILKPSEVSAATGQLIEKLFQRVPELTPYVRVVHGDGTVGAAVVEAGPDYIFLTGSTATGKKISRAAAERLIPVACELGGKDPTLVLEDADVSAAARWSVWGAFFNAGQACVGVERVYALESVYDEFVSEAIRYTRELKQGFTLETNSPYHLGPMTFPRQVDIVRDHLNDAVARGARIILGGKINGPYIEPTIVLDATPDMALMRDETFGPVLPIVKVRDEQEAIQLANDSRFGFGASVWSRDHAHARRVARELHCADILINDALCQFAVPMLPVGGVGDSGSGRFQGQEGFMQFVRSHAYLEGGVPLPFDPATILREPGHYEFGKTILKTMFGANWQQRAEPVQTLTAQGLKNLRAGKLVETIEQAPPEKRRLMAGVALGVLGAVAAAAFFLKKKS